MERVEIPFFENGSAVMLPSAPGDRAGHPTCVVTVGPDGGPYIQFGICGRCLMESLEQAITEGAPPGMRRES